MFRSALSLLLIAGMMSAAPLEAHTRHCDAPAPMGGMAGKADDGAAHDGATLGPASADCPHCPATDCARSAECGTATSVAASAASRHVVALHAARAGRAPMAEPFPSRPPLPPTPPPQPIL